MRISSLYKFSLCAHDVVSKRVYFENLLVTFFKDNLVSGQKLKTLCEEDYSSYCFRSGCCETLGNDNVCKSINYTYL